MNYALIYFKYIHRFLSKEIQSQFSNKTLRNTGLPTRPAAVPLSFHYSTTRVFCFPSQNTFSSFEIVQYKGFNTVCVKKRRKKKKERKKRKERERSAKISAMIEELKIPANSWT